MKRLSVLLMSLLLTGCDDAAQGSEDHALAVVYRQVEAFNRHDVDGIMAVIHPEFKWFSVNGDAGGHRRAPALAACNRRANEEVERFVYVFAANRLR